MPEGDVWLYELAVAVKDRLESHVDYLAQHVQVVDADPDGGPEDARSTLGSRKPYEVIVGYEDPALVPNPAFTDTIDYQFRLFVRVLWRKPGSLTKRVTAKNERDISKITKDAIRALQGERLLLLNRGGLQCGPASFVTDASALRAMQFTVTGNSREKRS